MHNAELTTWKRLRHQCGARALRGLRSLVLAGSTITAAACAATDANETVREQRGDTLVVRSNGVGRWGDSARLLRSADVGAVSGSDTVTLGNIRAIATGPDGRVYATDGQQRTVRVFDAALIPLALWGRDGSGPGELRNPDGGLAVLSNGRVGVRDPGNGRLQLFAPDGRSAGEWPIIPSGLRTRDNFARQGDTLLSRVVTDASGPIDTWAYGLARISPEGVVVDTLPFPPAALPLPRLIARGGNNTAEIPLPFAASSLSAWHPNGGFASVRGDRYAITWPDRSGVIQVERQVDATPVTAAEAEQERAYVTQGLRWLDPSWTWTGPNIPDSKPFISQLFTGTDGSVWVVREGRAVDRDDPDYVPDSPTSVERRLRSQLTFDVFETSGDFLGSLRVPEGLQLRPQPVFDTSGLVGLEINSEGVPRLVRYRVTAAK